LLEFVQFIIIFAISSPDIKAEYIPSQVVGEANPAASQTKNTFPNLHHL
jgi:hypothetical protein